jgi:hypothetical protein
MSVDFIEKLKTIRRYCGNCKVQGESLVCTGPFTTTIPDPSGFTTIGSVTVIPGESPIRQVDISVGSYPGVYLAKYKQGKDMSEFGNSACGLADPSIIYHQAMIYYDGKPKLQSCVAVPVVTGMAAQPLYFGTNWLRAVPGVGGFFQLEDPSFWVKWDLISTSSIDNILQKFMQYPIVISGAQQSTEIRSVNVVHSRYKIF